jgi:hypothetical protein
MHHSGGDEARPSIAQVVSNLEQHIAQVEVKSGQRIAQVEAKMDAHRAELIKWMFVFWAETVIPVLGMVVLLTR